MFQSYLLFVVLFVALAIAAGPGQLAYRPGQLFKYQLQSSAQTGTQQAPGPLSKMVGTVEVECTQVTSKGNYMFVMNMFNVQVQVDHAEMTSLNVAGQPLGYDMYFEQTPSGSVVNVWYQKGDEPYFVQVKLGAINSFQTHVLQPGVQQSIQEADLVGTHDSAYVASSNNDGSTALNKGFTQANVIAFADKALKPSNVQLQASSAVGVHPQGYVLSTSVMQSVVFSSLSAPSKPKNVVSDPLDGFSTLITAQGSLRLSFASAGGARLRKTPPLQLEDLDSDYKSGTLLDLGALVGEMALARQATIEPKAVEEIQALFGQLNVKLTDMERFAAYLHANPDLISPLLEPVFDLDEVLLSRRLLAVLIMAARPEADELFIRAGLQSPTERTRIAALNSLSVTTTPATLIPEIIDLVNDDKHLLTSEGRAAALSLGSMATRAVPEERLQALQLLRSLLLDARRRGDVEAVAILNAAFRNAGMRLDDVALSASPYPYNQSYTKTLTLGGSRLSADFSAALFVGTNFDCSQASFNFEGSVTAQANVTLFGQQMTALNALAIYGQQGTTTAANQLLLEVFGKVVYNKPIPAPSFNCQQQTYPIGSFTAPGINVKYVLWVGCIPVILNAGVTLEADLSWGWQICPGTLSALVQLLPHARLMASASAEADLLIIEGAVALDAAFDLRLTPEALVDGTQCFVEFDLFLTANPMEASLVAEYRKMVCKWWFWDCDWGKWEKDTLWSWSAPADHKLLYSKRWSIQP